jgi:DNA-directed RNA polymerase sigma subunit (sigma70/sigma32)
VTLISLDERPGRDGGPALAETLADPNLEPAEDGLLREEAVDLLRLALASLGTQERTVLEARFGLDGRESRTLREIGEQLRLSRERVRQIEKHGRRKIRDFFCRRTRPREQMRPARPGRSAAAASSAATAATQFRSRGTVPRHPYAMEAAS